jgi:hypothetical protein
MKLFWFAWAPEGTGVQFAADKPAHVTKALRELNGGPMLGT